jgi:hypothetical protein
MADRYWVGGSGTWDASTTTNWATTSGGAGGASAPTSADNAYFDGSSDSGAPFTVTIGTGAVCRDVLIGDGVTVTALDQTMTLAGTAAWFIYGSLYFPATNLTRTFAGNVTFAATTTGHTITTNGVTLTRGTNIFTDFNGVGGEWTLGSALTTSDSASGANQAIYLIAGSLITAGYNITSGGIVSVTTPTGTRNLELGASVVTVVNPGLSAINFNSTTNFTLDAGTSTIVFTSPGSVNFCTGGLTFYNISHANVGLISVRGNLICNNFTISRTTTGIASIYFNPGTYTINGTLSVNASATNPTARIFFQSANDNFGAGAQNPIIGTQRTISAAAVSFGDGVDFRDVVASGVSAPWNVSTLSAGDCKNNVGITFPASKTAYRIGTGNWSATQWAATSGGSPAAANFPLAQDTCVFDANTTTGTHTLDASYNIGTLSMSAVTSAITLATGSTGPTFYGNVTLDADVTLSGTGTLTFAGQGTTQTITSAGVSFTQPITVNSPTGTVAIADALTTSGTFTLTAGALDITNQTLTCFVFNSSNSNTRSLAFGATGKVVVTGNNASVVEMSVRTNFSYTGTSRIELSYAGASGLRQIRPGAAGAVEANSLNYYITAGADSINLSPSTGFNEYLSVDFTGFAGTMAVGPSGSRLYGDLLLSSAMTVSTATAVLAFAKSSGSQSITTNGKTLDFPISKSDAGTLTLADNLTMGSTRTFTLTQGTLDLNGRTLAAQDFSTSNSNTRAIAFGSGGRINLSGSDTVFNAATGTNLTTTGTGVIDLTSASAKTFAGGGRTYSALNQGGAGTLSITGANTFANVTNTVQPTTITFPSGVTTSVQDFSVGGTLGNLLTLNASTPGSRAFLNKV